MVDHTFDLMIAWEQDDIEPANVPILFAALIKSGDAWTLPGCYGRQAKGFIEGGWLSPAGEILRTV